MSSTPAPFGEAIAGQPDALRAAADALSDSLASARIARWQPGQTVAVVSMGASTNSAHALVAHLATHDIRGIAYTASDLELAGDGYVPGDHCVFVSESGRSPEPLAAARRLPRAARIVITNEVASPLAAEADIVLPLGGFHDSGVYTMGYTSTLLAYSMLAEAAGLAGSALPGSAGDRIQALLSTLPAAAAMATDLLHGARIVDVVGRGFAMASATEAALMLREGARTPSAPYETYQYLHGPMEAADADTGAIVFGDGRETGLVRDLLRARARVVHVTRAPIDTTLQQHASYMPIALPDDDNGFGRAIADVVAAQLIVRDWADRDGIPVGTFRYEQSDTKLPPAA